MLFAAYNDTGYKVMLYLHILSVVVAFGPLFFIPLVARGSDQSAGEAASRYLTRFATPAIVLAGFFGLAMVGMSKTGGVEVFKFSQAWVGIALLLWIVDVAVFVFGLLPAQRKVAEGDVEAGARIPMFTGIVHLSLVVLLYLMIWKPGA